MDRRVERIKKRDDLSRTIDVPVNGETVALDLFALADAFDPIVEQLERIHTKDADILVLSGGNTDITGTLPDGMDATMLDVIIRPGSTFEAKTSADEAVFVLLQKGRAYIGGDDIGEENAAILEPGDRLALRAGVKECARMLLFSMRLPQKALATKDAALQYA